MCVDSIAIGACMGPCHRQWKLRAGKTRWRRKIWRMRESLKREINRKAKTDIRKQKKKKEGKRKFRFMRCFRGY